MAVALGGVTASGVTSTGATVYWTTNEAADSQVEYGTSVGYGGSTGLNPTMGTSHSQALSGLTPKHVIATGESQSAIRMTTYLNAIAPTARAAFVQLLVYARTLPSLYLE